MLTLKPATVCVHMVDISCLDFLDTGSYFTELCSYSRTCLEGNARTVLNGVMLCSRRIAFKQAVGVAVVLPDIRKHTCRSVRFR